MSPRARALVAFAAVAAAGRLASPEVWVLAISAAAVGYDLGRREFGEGDAPDWTGWGMQIGFLLVLCGGAWDNRHWPGLAFPTPIQILGFATIGAGVWLRKRTAEIMGAHFKVRIQSSSEHELVQSGPFRLLRHPSYASLGLVAIGTALATRSLLAFLAALLIWLPAAGVRIIREEAFLAKRFGDDYDTYASRTWRLVPGIF